MREIYPPQLLRALTPRRLANAARSLAGYNASRWRGGTYVWGLPFVAHVEPTNCCDLACPQCDTGAGRSKRARGFMPLALYRDFIEANAHNLIHLLLYDQGEPTLHPDYLEMIRIARQHRLYVVCSSNGQRLADDSYARGLVESGLDVLMLSADGITPAGYARYRRGGSLEKVQSAIALVRKWRTRMKRPTPRIQVQFVVMRHNEHEVAQAGRAVRQWGADEILFKSAYVRSAVDAAELLPSLPRFRRYRIDGERLEMAAARRGPCRRLWYSVVVHWDGAVVPCCFDKDDAHVMGRATQPLRDIWKNEPFNDFRARILQGTWPEMCGNCTHGLKIYPT